MAKNFHLKKSTNMKKTETDIERKKRLTLDRGKTKTSQSPTVSELDTALDSFDENVRACAAHLRRVAALQSIDITEEHAADVLATALRRSPLLWVSLGASRASQIILENVLENSDTRDLVVPDFTDIRSALPEEEAREFWRDVNPEVIRRLWRDTRLPKNYKPRFNATQGTSPNG